MKNIKVLLLSLLVSVLFFGCKDDEIEGLLPPNVDFNYTPTAPIEGQEILFYADRNDGSGEVAEWSWNFGDGGTSNKRNPYYTFASAGTYQVKLVVRNANGATYEVSKSVDVLPPPKEFIADVVWQFTNNAAVTKINEGSSAPVIGDDGTIYYVEGNTKTGATGNIVAVTDQGTSAQLKWATELGGYIANSPSIGPDGSIYVNTWTNDNMVYKLDGAAGTTLWTRGGRGVSNNTPAVDAQGNIYHGSRMQSNDGGAYSWSPTGEKRWEIVNVGAFYAAPVLSRDGQTVYFLNTTEGKLWAVNAADGTSKWSESVGMGSGTHGSTLSMDGDGTIYYTTNAHVVAITDGGESGSVKWSAAVTGAAQSGVVVGPNGHLYTGAGAGLVSLDPATGATNWAYGLTTTESVPAVDVNGHVYIGTSDGKLVVVNSAGQLLKEIQLGTGVVNSPTITENGTVYVEALDGAVIKLFKIAVEESSAADSPWPMKGQNVKSTGRSK